MNRRRLFTEAVDQILRKPINWGSLRQSIIDFSKNESKFSDCILGYENSFMSKDVLSTIQGERTKPIDFQDLADSFCSLYADDKAHSRTKNSNIAVVGYSCRLPGAPGNEALWQLLVEGRDMHKKIPEDRFSIETHFDPSGKKANASHTPFGCFIEEPGLFDPRFFNMSPREATETDPMHRLALVTAYEALEQSGFVANSTASTQQDRVGTFYGQTCDDWREVNAAQNIGTYFIPGGVRAFAPGRISYYFGFRGPSYSVDTACSSSLAAIQIACTSLQTGECDTALAGGVNVLTAPDIFAGLSRGQFLSKSGSCKTWDSKADGYCRADGVGSIVLKREEDAIADKDNIYGVILASATNHSADAVSITHPHAGNQSYLYRSILHSAGVDPLKVSYVELHGTGTQAGDMTEIKSVTDVFAPEKDGRSLNPEQALHIGAVKSNLGHSEAAAGITALIKVLLMMQENTIPPHVGIKNELNPGFPSLEARNVHIPFEKTKWSHINGEPRFAFVNNFSAAGGNTGLVIRDPLQRSAPQHEDRRGVFPFVLSSKSISSLQNNIKLLIPYIDQMPEDSLPSLSYTLTRRIHHNYRVGVVASNIAALKTSLQKNLEESNFAPLSSKIPKVTFVFTGQGSFYPGLGKQLYELSTIFRNEVVRLNELAITQELPAFLSAIDGSVSQDQELSPPVIQLALVCVQMALVKLWQSWGIQPSAVIGHSLGEYPALYAAGVLSADDTLHLVGSRAKLLQEQCTANSHMMLAVKASVSEIESKIQGVPYEYACFNSPRDTVLSGAVDDIDKVDRTLIEAGFKCVRMNLPYAFHSKQIDPALGDFEKIAGGAIFNKPNVPVISSLLGEVVEENGVFGPSYLRRQAREPVNLTEALEAASDNGFISNKTAFVEIGPHPICSSMVKAILGGDIMTASSLKKADNPWKTVSQSLCSLHGLGLEVDWRQFHADFDSSHKLLRLPSYSFDDKTYWIPYVNDWCLHKAEPRHEEPMEALQAPSPISTTSIQRVVSQEFTNNVGTVVAQSDLSEPSLRAAVLGHLVNGVGLCPSVGCGYCLDLLFY